MNPRRTTKITLKSSWQPNDMTEQFKLVTNAQESKILKTNVTTIKIKCPNNCPRRYSVEITYTSLEYSENVIMYTSENGSFQARKSLHK